MKNDLPEAVAEDGGGSVPRMLELRVRQIRLEAIGIHSYEFVDPSGGELPSFTAGAHLDVHLPGEIVRQYSISSDPAERRHYVIGVLRDEQGRGGSKALHESVHVGDLVRVSAPRNNFALDRDARKVLLLAGGIGVTPLKSMAHELDASGVEYELHYCAKDAGFAAFRESLDALEAQGKVVYHFDGGVPGKGLDIASLLAAPEEGTHVYYCGPGGFMSACAAAASAASWPKASVHFEHFKAPVAQKKPLPAAGAGDAGADEGSFVVRIHSTGQGIVVGPNESIAHALTSHGIEVATSCEAGLCGTCKIGYLSGDVDHQDFILSDEEHAECLTACVSRARSPEIELDL